MSRSISKELRSFVAIGLVCTAAYAVLYSALRGAALPPAAANALALAVTVGFNFAANRRYTFGATAEPLGRQLAGYAVAYCVGVAASSLALAAILEALGHPRGAADTAAGLAAGLVATIVRYALMRTWVFRTPLTAPAPVAVAAEAAAGMSAAPVGSAGADGPRGRAAGTGPA